MAACLSRKKKKDQFSEMETRVREAEQATLRLREENSQLHRQVARLQAEVEMLRGTLQAPASPPASPRRPLLLLSVLLVASLNLAPLGSVTDGRGAARVSHRRGGSLPTWRRSGQSQQGREGRSGQSQEGRGGHSGQSQEGRVPANLAPLGSVTAGEGGPLGSVTGGEGGPLGSVTGGEGGGPCQPGAARVSHNGDGVLG